MPTAPIFILSLTHPTTQDLIFSRAEHAWITWMRLRAAHPQLHGTISAQGEDGIAHCLASARGNRLAAIDLDPAPRA